MIDEILKSAEAEAKATLAAAGLGEFFRVRAYQATSQTNRIDIILYRPEDIADSCMFYKEPLDVIPARIGMAIGEYLLNALSNVAYLAKHDQSYNKAHYRKWLNEQLAALGSE